jgi:hypothetical protein
MSLTLHFHPLSSFCWKALVGLYEAGVPFEKHLVDMSDQGAREAFARLWPIAEPTSPDPSRSLFDELATGAERVRWTLEGLPWRDLEASRAAPWLRLLVREMAYSENATYSATQRFLEAFAEDVDLSRWIAVWFYEETRHPYVLLEWLRRAGEEVASDFVAKGRVSTPFMRSNVGTLVTNVVSEVVAAQAYRWLGQRSPEPTLARIALLIAGDEARHAASFFRFARRALEGGTPRDRARALEVLEAWLAGARSPTHPVAQMRERLGDAHAEAVDGLTAGATRARILHLVGLLLDLPLRQPEDVAPLLRGLLARAPP